MSIINQKRDVFTTIGSYKSMDVGSSLPRRDDSYYSVNNKDEPIPFLLDILKTVGGENAVDEALGGVIGEVIDESEEELVGGLENQLITPEADTPLNQTEFGNNGVSFKLEEIDVYGKYHQPNNNDTASELLYGGTEDSFDKAVRIAIENEGDEIEYEDLIIEFNPNNEEIKVKPKISGGAVMTLGAFISMYLKNTKLINKKVLVASTLDEIFGSVSKERGLSQSELNKQGKITKIIENVIAGDESLELNTNELNSIFEKARQKSEGVVSMKMGCCYSDYEVPIDAVSETLDNIVESTNRFEIGSEIANLVGFENGNDPKMGFFEKIVNTLVVKMVEATTMSPEVIVLMGIVSSVGNGGVPDIGEPLEYMKKQKTCILCMKKLIMKIIIAFLFALAVSYLVKLMNPIARKIAQEKINNYMTQLKSLVSFRK